MCSNFGLNLHPDRKPCALQWQWYNLATRAYEGFRRRFFPRALFIRRDESRPRPATREGSQPGSGAR
jgi:hypothetical protein